MSDAAKKKIKAEEWEAHEKNIGAIIQELKKVEEKIKEMLGVEENFYDDIPIGSIVALSRSTVPPGYLPCDG